MRMTRRRLGAVATGLVMAVTLMAGCSSAGTSGGGTSSETLTMIANQEITTMDPVATMAYPYAFGDQLTPIYDSLVRVDLEGKVTPQLAESLEPSDDFKIWTIKLRDGLKFSDATPLDAQAVIFNLERARSSDLPASGDAKAIAGIRKVDELTVEIVLTEVNPNFPVLLQGNLGMMASPSAIEELGEGYGNAPVGAGPYVFEKKIQGSSISYVKNPLYWDSEKSYPESLQIRFITDYGQSRSSFEAGEADLLHTTAAAAVEGLEGEGFGLIETPLYGGQAQLFNTAKAPTDDVRVRSAFYSVIDPEEVLQAATRGLGDPVLTLFPESSPFYNADLALPWGKDKSSAQAKIDEYIGEHGGKPLEIEWVFTTRHKAFVSAMSQQIEQNLKGVKIIQSPADTAVVIERSYFGDFHLVPASVSGGYPSPGLTKTFSCGSDYNVTGYCTQEMDQALRDGASTDDLAKRKAAYDQVQEIFIRDMPALFQERTKVRTAYAENLRGVAHYGDGFIDWTQIEKD